MKKSLSILIRLFQIGFYAFVLFCFCCFKWSKYKLKKTRTVFYFKGAFFLGLFNNIGGAYIKIGQIMSTRPDIFSNRFCEALKELQKNVTPVSAHNISVILKKNYSAEVNQVFKVFNYVPIASGGIGQVHKAKLLSGETVALKIKRPGIERQIKSDFHMLEVLAKCLSIFPFMKLIPFVSLVKDLKVTIEGQLDFKKEIFYNNLFADNFKGNEDIIIPEVFEEYCTRDIIAMEYFADLKTIYEIELSKDDGEKICELALHVIYQMMFYDGVVHGDLHPGNIFFLPDNKILLLDFGLVAKLEGKELNDYADFFMGMAMDDGKKCADIVLKSALYCLPSFDYDQFVYDMIELVDRTHSLKAEDFEASSFAIQLFEVEKKNGVKGATHFMNTILALIVFEGIIKKFHPKLDFQKEARKVLIEKIIRNAKNKNKERPRSVIPAYTTANP